MAKKKKDLSNVIQYRIETSTNIVTREIKYCITRITKLEEFTPLIDSVGGTHDHVTPQLIQEMELPPHDRDVFDGYLFNAKEDAQIALEKIIAKMQERFENAEIEII